MAAGGNYYFNDLLPKSDAYARRSAEPSDAFGALKIVRNNPEYRRQCSDLPEGTGDPYGRDRGLYSNYFHPKVNERCK
jgi:hypothetical protein